MRCCLLLAPRQCWRSTLLQVTLWGDFTQNPGHQLEAAVQAGQRPVLAAKGVRVGDFNGKSLSTLGSSNVVVDPDRPESGILRTWWVRRLRSLCRVDMRRLLAISY